MMLHDGFVVYVIVLLWDIEKNSQYVSRQNRSRFVKKGAHVSWIIRKTSLTSLPYGKIFIQVNPIVEMISKQQKQKYNSVTVLRT